MSAPIVPSPVRFLLSAGKLAELPPDGERCEVAVLGRSNVGKSSFINHVFNRKGLAKVSKTPGKTVCANVFETKQGPRWIDLPGYGYARLSAGESRRISRLMDHYCTRRSSLVGIIWLLDIRHPETGSDLSAAQWLSELALPVFPVFTKCDKVSRKVVAAHQQKYTARFSLIPGVTYSIHDPESRKRFWREFLPWQEEVCSA